MLNPILIVALSAFTAVFGQPGSASGNVTNWSPSRTPTGRFGYTTLGFNVTVSNSPTTTVSNSPMNTVSNSPTTSNTPSFTLTPLVLDSPSAKMPTGSYAATVSLSPSMSATVTQSTSISVTVTHSQSGSQSGSQTGSQSGSDSETNSATVSGTVSRTVSSTVSPSPTRKNGDFSLALKAECAGCNDGTIRINPMGFLGIIPIGLILVSIGCCLFWKCKRKEAELNRKIFEANQRAVQLESAPKISAPVVQEAFVSTQLYQNPLNSAAVWAKHMEGDDVWYVSSTGESVWELPPGAVLHR